MAKKASKKAACPTEKEQSVYSSTRKERERIRHIVQEEPKELTWSQRHKVEAEKRRKEAEDVAEKRRVYMERQHQLQASIDAAVQKKTEAYTSRGMTPTCNSEEGEPCFYVVVKEKDRAGNKDAFVYLKFVSKPEASAMVPQVDDYISKMGLRKNRTCDVKMMTKDEFNRLAFDGYTLYYEGPARGCGISF